MLMGYSGDRSVLCSPSSGAEQLVLALLLSAGQTQILSQFCFVSKKLLCMPQELDINKKKGWPRAGECGGMRGDRSCTTPTARAGTELRSRVMKHQEQGGWNIAPHFSLCSEQYHEM